MYAWITWIWEKREAKAHLETTTRRWWQQQQQQTDWWHYDKSHVEHAVGATFCIKVPKLRRQEKIPDQN
jgi:hypothetical protein